MTPPEPTSLHENEMFYIPLFHACWLNHSLVQLSQQIPWRWFKELYCPDNSRLGFPIRMMVGLFLLKYARGWSDEKVMEWWLDCPYTQYFCEKTHFQLDSSSLSRFRIRIGESKFELTLKLIVMVGLAAGSLKTKRLKPNEDGYHGAEEGGEVSDRCGVAKHVTKQEKNSQNKAYSAQALVMEYINKGQGIKRYEFAVKAGGLALPDNLYDSHKLAIPLSKKERITGKNLKEVFVDLDYRSRGISDSQVFTSSEARGVARLKRRQADKSVTGYIKNDG